MQPCQFGSVVTNAGTILAARWLTRRTSQTCLLWQLPSGSQPWSNGLKRRLELIEIRLKKRIMESASNTG